jgi:glycerophosphoryl diester phosphodiesterase
MRVIGHRGAAGHAPENTLLSVRRAVELGVDGVEVDVRLVRGELLLFHDETLERTTDGKGRIGEWEVGALRALDAGDGEHIPFLREVQQVLPPGLTLHAEMKGGDGIAEALAESLSRAATRERGAEARTVVSCFDPEQLRRLRRLAPRARIGLLFLKAPADLGALVRELRPESLHLSLDGATGEAIERAHALGLRVLVFTVNDGESLRRVRALGADGVFTDFPGRILACLRRAGDPGK